MAPASLLAGGHAAGTLVGYQSYDHRVDLNQWTNDAGHLEHVKVKERMVEIIPCRQYAGLKVKDWFDSFQD